MDNLVKEVSPLGAETSYTYDKHDIVTGKTDAKGNTTAYEVDLNGLVKSLSCYNLTFTVSVEKSM